jgi:hypothetical protein
VEAHRVVRRRGSPIFFYYWWGGTNCKSLGTAATSGLLYKPQMIDEDDCGGIGGIKIGRGNRSTRRKPAPAPLCPRLPYFLDNRLTDGDEVVSLTRRPPFTLRKIPGTHFCWRLSGPQGHSAA